MIYWKAEWIDPLKDFANSAREELHDHTFRTR